MVVLNDMQTEVSDYYIVRQGEGKSRCVFRAGFRNLMHSVSEELATNVSRWSQWEDQELRVGDAECQK